MRTIKFRGKPTNGEWVHGSLLLHNPGVFIHNYHNDRYISVDMSTIGQFIGFYDKVGTPIYEGDVVRWYSGWDNLNHLAAVQYVGELCQFLPVATIDGKEVQYTSEIYNCCEVVGNVHDNPEMAKGGVER